NPSTVSQETENIATTSQEIKCPKCGADLIIRTATRGANAGKQFYGCSNYPKCRYIENIK
ncbi:MAG: topoisomerase DNA-binding C4 zinc finger domain-containing protein, partial [Oscillospiraceae bacterium]|nr:topoisomerase DNA-binding C4 zinc finger domain-containing protein [Oscillospiraceae bacterium]